MSQKKLDRKFQDGQKINIFFMIHNQDHFTNAERERKKYLEQKYIEDEAKRKESEEAYVYSYTYILARPK